MSFAQQRRALFRHPNLQKRREHVVICTFWLGNVLRATMACTFSTSELPKVVFCTCWLQNVLRATTACTFSTSELPKVVRQWCVLYILTWKCASRHNGVHFFDIATSKSGPELRCFLHFDLQMCFAPQRRALFQHPNFQKRREHVVFCTFWLGDLLRATTACNFSSLIWPAGSAPAALASLLFDLPEPQIIGKTECFATFLPFRASPSSFLLIFSSLEHAVFCTFWLGNVLRATAARTFSTSEPPKEARTCGVLYILTQRRPLFQHPNLQKWREPGVFCTFWLGNVLRATTACTFSTSQLPKVVRAWCVLYILTSKGASRHNGVHFFNISTSKSGPSMVCFVHFDFKMCFAPQRRALFQHLNFQKWSENGVFCAFWLQNLLRATTACTFSTSELPKGVREWCGLYILTWKCASRHSGVHFFDIATSKSSPTMVCFVHFDLEMCFAPQWRALFRHLNFQKWSDNGVFCTFWLGNVLRATTACTFSTSQLPNVVWAWCVLYILTWKCASRHNGVHFFNISTSKSGPTMVCFVHFDFKMCFAPQRRGNFQHLNFQKWSENGVFCAFWLQNVLRATTASKFSTSQLPKVVRTWCVLYILTWKCASRHNGVHFFDISTSKRSLSMVCFVHFDFEMCFTPQRRALFRHLNFQKWSEHGVFCTFWLRKVLRATTACTFSTSQLPKVVRAWCVLYILTSKCASRHNGVHFFNISTSKSGPRMVCFVHFDFKICFAPQRRANFHLSSGELAPRPPL